VTTLYQPTQAEIDHAAEAMTVAYTGDSARIARAAQLIAAGAVEYTFSDWTAEFGIQPFADSTVTGWAVRSQRNTRRQDPEEPEPTHYAVTSTSCGCYDHMLRASAIGNCGDQTITVRPACKHIFAVQMYLRIIAAKLDAAVSDPESAVYLVEMRDRLYGVNDRLTDAPICGALYIPKTDSYRPEGSQDAADFARWLGAQPVAVDAAQWFPGGLLEKILRSAPDKVTLRADVVYGSPRIYTLSGYRYDGGTWVHLEHAERQQFNEGAWTNVLAACGFIQPVRPVKQNGLAYHYILERGDNSQEHYGLGAAAGDYAERQATRRMFERDMDGGAQL
jgi:hypothetical protein